MQEQRYCKRLMEVDLPIKRISEHARREKSVGHISALHIWWARRPLAACRAVICASMWLDPFDPLCPSVFRDKARNEMLKWTAHEFQRFLSVESRPTFESARKDKAFFKNDENLRRALLDFIADFSNFDNTTKKEYLETSRIITQAAYEALGGDSTARPLVLDPFAGGGAIPLEALRVGADVVASDLNPIPVLLNKVLIEYIPKYGQRLLEQVGRWGEWIKFESEKELGSFYPSDPDGSVPVAYLWAKTIRCEGPACGVEIPIIRSPWLAKKDNQVYFNIGKGIAKNKNIVTLDIENSQKPKRNVLGAGTVKRGSVTCPICGFTIPRQRVEVIAKQADLGERMIAVILTKKGRTGRIFRSPEERDFIAFNKTEKALASLKQNIFGNLSTIPEEPLPYLRSIFNVHVYGVTRWAQLFNNRQLLSAVTFAKLAYNLAVELRKTEKDEDFIAAIVTIISLAVDRQINAINRTCYWNSTGQKLQTGFARQAIPMFWDYCEANPFGGSVGSWESMVRCVSASFDVIDSFPGIGNSFQASATQHPLPDDCVDAVITDPPYYDLVPFADLSDFFYIWLKRMLSDIHPSLFRDELTPKKLEIVQLAERNPLYGYKTKENFENLMVIALEQARRIAKPHSVSVIFFAHQSTSVWETMVSAVINAGWIVTASWPIDTEMPTRVRAQNSAVLASSIQLLCRPRENIDGSLQTDAIGDWRDVLQELPKRIHQWMPHLSKEGIVGADAIFACLGPALEIFSKYSRVEKANGDNVELREYLEQVWGAVAKEALNMIFQGVRAEGFEEDARLTAMWLWTLSTGSNSNDNFETESVDNTDEDGSGTVKSAGFSLEYDAARKIAQGLGAHLENLSSVIEIDGDQARLLPVAERAGFLFGKGSASTTSGRKKKKESEITLFEEFNKVEDQGWSLGDEKSTLGKTILDKLHQSMILFGAGRGDALRRFLVDESVGKDERFWRLAQAFSALYPSNTDEKRWIDGVLARKKGLGF